jgi:hypothetical protein
VHQVNERFYIRSKRQWTTTTLYDLMTELQVFVYADDHDLVVATIINLIRSGRMTLPQSIHVET